MATQSATKVTKKAFLRDLNITFGVMEATGDLFTPLVPNANKAEKFRMACPTCALKDEAVPVAQRYICTEHEHDGEVYEPYECGKFKEVDDEYVLVDAEAVQAAKEASDLPDKKLILTAHDAKEVAPYLVNTGNTYIFQPGGESNFYGVLLRIIGDDGLVQTDTGPKVLMGEMLVRKEEKIFKLGKWNGQVVIQEVARPEDIDSFAERSDTVPDKLVVLTKTLIDTGAEDFKPDEYRKSVRDRYADVIAEAQGGAPVAKKAKAAPADTADDLIAKLEAAIQANVSK